MKFLLVAVNAKYIHSNLAVFDLKAYAEGQERHPDTRIEIAEYTINQPEDGILEDIYRKKPDAVGVSCYIWNIGMVRRLVENLHRIRPDLPIWLGGPEVSFECEKTLRQMPGAAGILAGEGEQVFHELLRFYEGKRRLEEIPGLTYRTGMAGMQAAGEAAAVPEDPDVPEHQEIVSRPPVAPMDLSRVPFPYRDFGGWDHKIVYYESSRGCPFSCSYCLSSVDKALRFRDLALVKAELQQFLDARIPQVKFVDRTFNCKKSHAMAIWEYIASHDNGVTNFHFEVAADLLDEEAFALLAKMRPGQVQLEIGVQSTNPETLRQIRRFASFDKISEAVRRVKSFGNIHQHLDLIAGLPCEDYASFGRSFDEVYALKPDQLQLGFLKVLKGSFMYENQAAYGLCWKPEPPYEVLFTKWLSYEDVICLKGVEEMVEVYYNSGQFTHTLAYLERLFAGPFAMYEALAEYTRETTAPGQNFNRNARYEKLLDFVRQAVPQAEEETRVLLTYDLYLREKVKSRPAFAGDPAAWKEELSGRQSEAWEAERAAGETVPYRQYLHETHLECLGWDVERLARDGVREEGEFWYRFDYRRRDPLSGNAAVFCSRGFSKN